MVVAALSLGACASRPDTSHDKDALRAETVLGVQLMVIADLGHGISRDVYARAMVDGKHTSRQIAALSRVIAGVGTTMRSIAIAPSPHDGLVQMYIWCRVGRFTSDNRMRMAPDFMPDLGGALYGRIQSALQPIAEQHLTATQRAALDAMIEQFERANPDLLSVGLTRLDDIAQSRDAASLVLPDTPPDMLSPVTDAARQLELTRLLGTQGLWLLARTSDAIAMEIDGTTRMLLEADSMRQIVDRVGSVEGALGSAGTRLESVAASQHQIGQELRALSDAVDGIGRRVERMVIVGGIAAAATATIAVAWLARGRRSVQ
jgi:hypothetical protein